MWSDSLFQRVTLAAFYRMNCTVSEVGAEWSIRKLFGLFSARVDCCWDHVLAMEVMRSDESLDIFFKVEPV